MELELELSEAGASSLLEKNPFGQSPTILRQTSVYFDTVEGDLSKRGLSLRIRQCGEESIQTVKSGHGSAARSFTREEWQRPVAGDVPVLDYPDIASLLAGAGDTLAPMFEVHVHRHRWNVTEGDATVEVALDLGKIVAADRETALCELQLERKTGSPAALVSLARKVDLITPAHISVLSKAERGYRLLGTAPGAIKASVTPLATDINAATIRVHSCSVSQTVSPQRNHPVLVSQCRYLASSACIAAAVALAFFNLQVDVQAARNEAYGAAEASLSSLRARSDVKSSLLI